MFEDYDKGYPKETSQFYFYDKENIASHSEVVLGRQDQNLLDKLNDFRHGIVFSSNVVNFEKYKKVDCDSSDFFVEKMYNDGYIGSSSENRFSDSPYVYLLGSDDDYAAILSFEPRPSAVLVTQIQGFRGGREVWNKIRYPDLLLDVCYNDLKGLGVPEMWVSTYKRNQWKSVRDNFCHTKERQYDKPAKRCDFNFSDDLGVWVKKF